MHVHHNWNKYFYQSNKSQTIRPYFHCVSRYSYITVILDIKQYYDIMDYRDEPNKRKVKRNRVSRIFYIYILK